MNFKAFAATTSVFFLTLSDRATADDQALLNTFDADHDKVLSDGEIPALLSRRLQRLDRNRDGRLGSAELAAIPDRFVQRLLNGDSVSSRKAGQKPGEVYAPAAREEFDTQRLAVGDPAPDFTLQRSDGGGDITLSDFRGRKPVVLVFGSITCSPFRQEVMSVPPIYEKFGAEAEFFMVYIREAHPESIVEVPAGNGKKQLQKFLQTDDFESRLGNAQTCSRLTKLPFPTLVDREDNRVKEAYAGWPIRLMVVDNDGKIAYDGGPGPKGFVPQDLDAWLSRYVGRKDPLPAPTQVGN